MVRIVTSISFEKDKLKEIKAWCNKTGRGFSRFAETIICEHYDRIKTQEELIKLNMEN